MHIDVGIGTLLVAVTVWLLAVILGWPAGHPGVAVAVLAGYLVFMLAVHMLPRRPGPSSPGHDHRRPR